MIVVAFHLFETYSAGTTHQTLNHGYLAVDFFFALSGFVIGYAYDDRWGSMSLKNFFKRRLIRLHPMVVMGSIIGLLCFYFGAEAFPAIADVPAWKALLACIVGCTLLPLPMSMDIRGWGEMHPLNGASWSLFWEYVANVLYALVIRRLPNMALAACVCVFALLTVDLCMNLNLFGLLTEGHAPYTPIGGWSLNAEQCYIGLSRLLYPFFAGLLLSRLGAKIRVKNGFAWCSAIIVTTLCFPYAGSETYRCIDGLYNTIVILVVFPVTVAMGAGSVISGGKSERVCKFLGEISYPLYITHYPLIYVQMSGAKILESMNAPDSAHILMSVFVGVAAVAIAYASLKLWDLPVRERLTKVMKVGANSK